MSLRFSGESACHVELGLDHCGDRVIGSRKLIIREESEKVSELKSLSGGTSGPAANLASGADGIKDEIQGFNDA